MRSVSIFVAALAAIATSVNAQTFRRTAACPDLGCVFPPDQTDFIAGQVFDIRVEIQAPLNGSQPYNNGVPNPDFAITFGGKGGVKSEISKFFNVAQPAVEKYNFTYYEDLFARDNKSATLVNVISQTYRYVTLYNPGEYELCLSYNGNQKTIAEWTVLPLSDKSTKQAKNAILFIGDGMTTSMITAGRLLGHKSVNGKYKSKMFIDGAPAYGSQMTHSLDSFITDSANSATALYSGKKGTVNALNAYTDSTGKTVGNPKYETTFEMFRRITGGAVGIVSTAYLADATPAAVNAHTSSRSAYDLIVDQFLSGVVNYTWTKWDGPDVIFGGGGSDFLPKASNGNVSKVDRFKAKGYQFATDNTTLYNLPNDQRALGLFCNTTMATWLDRNVYKQNMGSFFQYDGTKGVYDSPGLKEMTLKAIDILAARSKKRGTGFMLMSEAASIDKAMHIADYERALSELLELDNTVKATVDKLKSLGLYEETLVIVTADHGHGFDVYGSADTAYLQAQNTNETKRDAVGTYVNSGLSQYQVAPGSSAQNSSLVMGPQGFGFPVQWAPRYTAAFGMSSIVDHFENFQTPNTSRKMAIQKPGSTTANPVFVANPQDSAGQGGFYLSGNLPVADDQGVHSLTDVPVYAWGPGSDAFRGHQNSVDIAYKLALALNLGRTSNVTVPYTP